MKKLILSTFFLVLALGASTYSRVNAEEPPGCWDCSYWFEIGGYKFGPQNCISSQTGRMGCTDSEFPISGYDTVSICQLSGRGCLDGGTIYGNR